MSRGVEEGLCKYLAGGVCMSMGGRDKERRKAAPVEKKGRGKRKMGGGSLWEIRRRRRKGMKQMGKGRVQKEEDGKDLIQI